MSDTFRKMSVRVDAYSHPLLRKKMQVLFVRIKITERLVTSVGIQFKGNIMNGK